MSLLKLINPQGMIGQLIVLAFFVAVGVIIGIKSVPLCGPTTQVNVKQNIKGKKGAVISSNLATTVDGSVDCNEWLKTLSKKEIKAIRRD